jgi:tRNA threonylcarbamoyladenosine biosynthesis protein TsaE
MDHHFCRMQWHLPDEAATNQLAVAVAHAMGIAATPPEAFKDHLGTVACGGVIHLQGALGAGKTAFCRALLRSCGITGRIKSPSYALLETYKVSNLYFYHLDFYRFSDPREWLDAGFRDIIRPDAVVLIEWPEKAADLLPPPDFCLDLNYADSGRDATLVAHTPQGQQWLTTIVPPAPTGALPLKRPL